MTEFRDELRYTREHEWAKEENGRIVVGIVEGGPASSKS